MVMKTMLARSMEAIAHQGDDGFFRDLTKAIHFMRENEDRVNEKDHRELITESEIESTILARSGLFVKFHIDPNVGFNAYAMPELVDPNNMLGNGFMNETKDRNIKKTLDKIKEDYVGVVDLENGRVSGAFSKLVVPVAIGLGLLLSRDQDKNFVFDDDEIAAIILHELGHAFTFFEYVGRQTLLTHTLGETARVFGGSATPKRKVEVAKYVKKTLEIDDLDEEAFGEIDDEATYQSLVMGMYNQNRRISATQSSYYDTKTVEAVADQFVSRMGGGRAQATAMDKIHRFTGASHKTRSERFAKELIGYISIFSFYAFFGVITAGGAIPIMMVWTILFIAGGIHPSTYDSPYDRIKRIHDDMVKELKNSKLTKEQRSRAQENIQAVDQLLEQIHEHRFYITAFFEKIIPSIRKGIRQKKVIQKLEALDANNLYKHSNDFQLAEGD